MASPPASADGRGSEAIAIVGMACRFPGDATDIEAFWETLKEARDAWSEIPGDRFNAKGWYHPDPNRPGSFHIRGAHFIKGDIAAFDAPFFSISTAEAVSMDPQQRMLLEVVYEALDSAPPDNSYLQWPTEAGIPVATLSNTATSVFCGSFVRDYEQPCMRDPDTTPSYSATGNGIAILANRVSHAFDFAGTSQTIDTGCSASMIAVHQACKSLLNGESTVGIAAGVGLIFSPNTLVPMANLNILGADGRCYTFDKQANGYGRGEGVGVVVLKKLEDAIASNDTIRAVIRATASNQDGHTQGITLPSKERQVQNMTEIYRNNGLDNTRTAYMECHGTGTQAGDVKEVEAVTEVFCQHRTADNPLMIGSVKTNIGHLEGSAGVAGLIKGVLVVERGFIPKHLNFSSPNPKIDFQGMKLKVATELTPWPVAGLRRASVNSFGFGGTNAHVVLDDAPHFFAEFRMTEGHHSSYLFPGDGLESQVPKSNQVPRNRLFVFSGHDEAGLDRVIDAQARYLAKRHLEPNFEANYAYTLLSRRSRLNWRTFIVAASTTQLLQRLREKNMSKPFRAMPHIPDRLALVFSGQGAQWHAMGRELLNYQVFYASVSAASWYMSTVLGSTFHLWDELHSSKELSRIDEPQIAQPATTVIQMALVDLLTASGIQPAAVVGHSSGEIAAAYAAGAIHREDAWKIAYHRGQCVSFIPALAPNFQGGMLAVALGEVDARRGIADSGIDSVDVACVNGPASVTLSGDSTGISQLCDFFRSRNVRATPVNVSVAYHSQHMQVIEATYREALNGVTPMRTETQASFFSSVFGRAAEAHELGADYWVKNLVLPVQFHGAVTAMLNQTNPQIFLEVSPHRVWESTLQQICSSVAADKRRGNIIQPTYISLLHRQQDASMTFLKAMGELWKEGLMINADWSLSSAEQKPCHMVDVPSYPWDHSRRYWHESHLSKANRFRSHGREDIIGAPLENSTPQDPRWRGFFRVQENPWLQDHVIQKSIIYPGGGMIAMAIEAAKQLADSCREILGFEVTNFTIIKPMLIPLTPQGLENMLSAHLVERAEESAQANKATYGFSILSKPEDAPWTTHATGRFAIVYLHEGITPESALEGELSAGARRQAYHLFQKSCHTQLVPRQFYEMLDVIGMTYGPQFRNLAEIAAASTSACAVVRIPDTKAHMPFNFEFDHVIHPATLDTMLQTVLAARTDDEAMLPCSAARIFVSANLPKGAGSLFRGYATARKTTPRSARAEITMFDDQLRAPAVVIDNLEFKSVPKQANVGGDGFLPSHRNLCSEFVWKQDIGSLASLDMELPGSVPQVVDLASHKNPSLSILFHRECRLSFKDNGIPADRSGRLLDNIVSDSAKIRDLCFGTLVDGYETPRFSQCVISGLDSDKVLHQLRTSESNRPSAERMKVSQNLSSEDRFDVVLCSVDKQFSDSFIANMSKHMLDNSLLILAARDGTAFDHYRHQAFRDAIQKAGLQMHKLPEDNESFMVAHKATTRNGLDTKHETVMFLLPNEMSPFVVLLKDAIRPLLEEALSVRVSEVPFHSISTMTEDQLRIPTLSFIELVSPVLFSMDPHVFASIHRLLTLSKGLMWLTHDGQLAAREPKLSPSVGLARTLRSEDHKKKIVSLDIETGHNDEYMLVPDTLVRSTVHLFKKICTTGTQATASDDVEFVYSGGRLMIPRLMPLALLNNTIEQGLPSPRTIVQTRLLAEDKAMKLDVSTVGTASGPLFVEDRDSMQRPLLPNEVRIAVMGTNLLPEDIALAAKGAPMDMMGTDVFGSVVEVGSEVSNLLPHCYVVAQMRDTIKTHVIADQSRIRQITPQGEWLRRCPTALATAMYALVTSRRILKDDFVLVYGVSSAYGQTAIRLAAMLGAHILVACSTPNEKQLIQQNFMIPACNILDVHDKHEALEARVRSLTKDRGVDVVFDPTSQHIKQAFRCVAECGRVVRVAWNGCELPNLQLPSKNFSFETVDIDLLKARCPGEMEKLATDMDDILEFDPDLDLVCGTLEYSMCDLETALKIAAADMFAGPHMLTTDTDKGPNTVNTPVESIHKPQLSPSATYLLVGGLGGLGRSISEHLAKNGAEHIAFFSRSGAVTGPAQSVLAKLRDWGVDARAFAVDICNAEQLAASIMRVHEVMPAIKGVIQCAAVVDDAAFPSMDYGRWKKSFEPKTIGSYNLHRQLPRDMDFFVFLSSSSGVIGNRGQANYSAGNSFQDALARHRTTLGMHSVSIDLGLVLGAGMVAENEGLLDAMRASGFIGIRLQDALLVLDWAMARPRPEEAVHSPAQIVTTVGTGGLTIQNQPSDPFWTRTALFRYLNQVDAPPGGLKAGKDGHVAGRGDGLRAAIQGAATLDDASRVVCTELIATVARRKGMVPADFDQYQSLSSYGIDSLDSIFVLGWISRETGVTVQTVERVTIAQLSRDVARRTLDALEEEQA